MTLDHLLTSTVATLTLVAALGAPTTAQAQSAGCAAVDGFTVGFFDLFTSRQLTTSILDEGEVVTVTADRVDLFLVTASAPIWNFANLVGNIESPRFPESSTPISESWTIPTNGITGLQIEGVNSGLVFFEDFNVSCTPVAPALALGVPAGDVAQVTISSQHGMINGALTRTAAGRLRGVSGNTASRGLTFLSTSGHDGAAQPLNAWVSFGVRGYFDRLEGETTHLTFGADYALSANTLVGAMIGIDQTSL